MNKFLTDNFKWFAQGSMRLVLGESVIYIDPFKIDKEYNDADFILLTHSHFDHFSLEDINKVILPETVIIAPCEMKQVLNEYKDNMKIEMLPCDTIDFEEFSVEAVAAYNTVKTNCHPKGKNWLGYILSTEEMTFYYTGDTELIEEMNEIKTDIIALPLGQTYTFESLNDAVKAVEITGAEIAIPVHYGLYEGSKEDFELFCDLAKGRFEVYKA